MREIALRRTANQSLTVNLGGNRWGLRIKQARSSMFVDVSLNDEPLLLGQRVAVGTPVIPYEHLAQEGNFIFLSENGEMADWRKFGVTQQLLHVSPGMLLADDPIDFAAIERPRFDPVPLMPPFNLVVGYI